MACLGAGLEPNSFLKRDPQANKETIWLAHMPTKDDLLIFREFLLQAWHVWVLAWNPTMNKLLKRRNTL